MADGVNVDSVVYQIRTRITAEGSRVEQGNWVGKRDRRTRAERWEQLDEDLEYEPSQLDRDVVAEDQIRTIVRAFRDRLFTELFPGRTHTPKTIVFAKDDNHAETIVRIIRQEFGRGNEFCQKITYQARNPEDLIASFRNSYYPRIAVTVDMISTGTDIKPVECLLFMRLVKSRVLFEQMMGRGTRVIHPTDLEAVTPDAGRKDHFLIVDAVGIFDHPKVDTQSLDSDPTIPLPRLLEQIALGRRDADALSSLATRLARLEPRLSERDAYDVAAASGGPTLRQIVHGLLDAIDLDQIEAAAREADPAVTPTPEDLTTAADHLAAEATRVFDHPDLRNLLIEIQKRNEITIDQVSVDEVKVAGLTDDTTAQALNTVESFRRFIVEHKDEIAALDILYRQPYRGAA